MPTLAQRQTAQWLRGEIGGRGVDRASVLTLGASERPLMGERRLHDARYVLPLRPRCHVTALRGVTVTASRAPSPWTKGQRGK